MSRSTRCQCGHTPGRRFYCVRIPYPCDCDCHFLADVTNPPHPDYGPTPVQRQPSKATGQLCPLVIRRAS